MTDTELQRFELLWPVLLWGSVIAPPVLLFCLAKAWKHLPKTVYWIAAPVLVWLLMMSLQRGIGSPIGHEHARRSGDEMYDGTGANAAVFILGLPMGLFSTAVIYGLGIAICKARRLVKRDAEQGGPPNHRSPSAPVVAD